ncbi:flavodoxin [Vibrio neptunius]|uniref:Flavodoxin n=1 Tax=Vibrio neptunius TaxID=170651 RepID=A0ABS3A8K5_9VIBR|nr:flavodoxin [Vibrio neptunius]MBN3495202.1 flavodoxin [Vibrio neptunius]MBN3517672.1 flavodoxin [Vibrio neptunius]MBN3551977.1 flavodoxin [Vibrio neptunius]MBN3580017.1 flavodoxin [Vibrio neptunius]MCH9873683.1 flavodoxin [Vibrio neptunius]
MSESASSIIVAKNQWLSQHVDVEFPTQESLLGRALFLEKSAACEVRKLSHESESHEESRILDIYKVDFHRLTVMFALLQSKRWDKRHEQKLIVEFLSQIIFSEPCDLYIAFLNGESAASAIVTKQQNTLLISDIVTLGSEREAFIASLLSHQSIEAPLFSDIYIES